MIGVFLDDERIPTDVFWIKYPDNIQWRIVRTYDEFCSVVPKLQPDIISFDHDLMDFDPTGKAERTGFHCLKTLVDWCMIRNRKIPKCLFHTMNPIGKENMESYYTNYLRVIETEG